MLCLTRIKDIISREESITMTMQYPKIRRDQQGGEASLHQESLQHPDGPAGHHGHHHLLVCLHGQRQGIRQGERRTDG